jgi:hypothetical protein
VVEQHQLGEVVETIDQLVEAVARMMEAPDRRRVLGARARSYVERHHGPGRTFEPLADLLDRVIEERRLNLPS